MATFRKSVSKTRAALENSTALPPPPSDSLDHVGEDAARITTIVKAAKSTRKAATPPPSSAAQAPLPQSTDVSEAASSISVLDRASHTQADGTEALPSWSGEPAVTAEALAEPAQPVVVAAKAAGDLAARSVGDAAAEITSVMADVADQVSHAGVDAIHTAADLTAHNLSETAAQAQDVAHVQDIAHAAIETTASSLDTIASAADQASTIKLDAPPSHALGEFNARLADLFRQHFEDSLTFFAAITAVRSVPEALTVNQQHFQRRLDAISTHSRDLTLLAGKVAAQTLMPFTPTVLR